MCGINGIISDNYSIEEREIIIKKMNERLAHRGPDNSGTWANDNISLGHQRLSIIDLSADSNQPFCSNDQRYILVYNGELYNYKELKLILQTAVIGSTEKPYFFKTNSDTEVILASYIRWGNKCLDYFNGMFSFAVYDSLQKKLTIVRDRIGVKPLYYYYGDEGFIFSSEIRPIIHSGIKKFSINKKLLAEYAKYSTVHAPNTIVKGISVLMPGHLAEYQNEKANLIKYYNISKSSNSSEILSYKEICKKTNELLTQSVQSRLVSDVPYGAFLSGGIDSASIIGLMSKVSAEKIHTFNINFDENEFSESKYAQIIAKKFNTEHHEIKLKPLNFLIQIPEAIAALDHPSGDGINTYCVSKATKNEGITMVLSGIGGDELFAGYDIFKRMSHLQNKTWLNYIPTLLRKVIGNVIRLEKNSISGNKINELLGLSEINFKTVYPINRSLFNQKELMAFFLNPDGSNSINNIMEEIPQTKNHLLSAVSIAEINTYLQNILLRDADQMSMALALEIREPFLDYKLIDFILSVEDEHKYPTPPKKLLVDSMGDLLPAEIVNRKKMGFVLPWQYWLKNDLKNFCEKNILLLEDKKIFIPGSINSLWNNFLKGDSLITWSRIWHFIVLNNWIDENKIEY